MTDRLRNRIRRHRSTGEAGFTLVEILVALALLLVGIYAALRIFPTGFGYMEFSRNRVLANNLGRAELERVKSTGGSLPEAIVATDPFGNVADQSYFASLSSPGGYSYDPYNRTPRRQGILGELESNPGWEPDGVYLPRLIVGEAVTIPPLGEAGRGVVPVHLLNYAPIDYLHYDASGSPQGDPIQVRSRLYEPVHDRSLLASLPPCSHHYYLDYGARQIYFRFCDQPRRVAIDYTYLGDDDRSHDVLLANPTVVPPTAASGQLWTGPIPLPDPPSGWPDIERIVPGTVQVYEVFEFDSFVPAGSAAPALDAGKFAMQEPDARGNLDPAGRIYFSTADAGRTVKIDYRVRDWGIAREDHRVESGGRVTLAVADVAVDKSYANPPRGDNPVALDSAGNPVFVLVIGLSDGRVYYPDQDFTVDGRHGVLTFNSGVAPGAEVRVFYRSYSHWTVQVMKPAAVYRRDPATGGDAFPGYQSFLWGAGNNGGGQDLYFSPQYAGMMVTVDYQYPGPGGQPLWMIGELHQITPVSTVQEPIPSVPTGMCGIWRDSPDGPTGLRIEPLRDSFPVVRGASVRVRTIWAEKGGAQAEEPLPGFSRMPTDNSNGILGETWREVNLDTQLTKAGEWGAMP